MMEKKILNAVEYLNQIQEADRKVRKLERQIQNLEMLATDIAHHMNGPIGHGQVDYDKTGMLTAEICDAKQELEEARKASAEIREEVGGTINRIENEDAKDVLMLRYLKGMKYDQIAEKLSFSVRRVYQLRKKGIREIERIREES